VPRDYADNLGAGSKYLKEEGLVMPQRLGGRCRLSTSFDLALPFRGKWRTGEVMIPS